MYNFNHIFHIVCIFLHYAQTRFYVVYILTYIFHLVHTSYHIFTLCYFLKYFFVLCTFSSTFFTMCISFAFHTFASKSCTLKIFFVYMSPSILNFNYIFQVIYFFMYVFRLMRNFNHAFTLCIFPSLFF